MKSTDTDYTLEDFATSFIVTPGLLLQ